MKTSYIHPNHSLHNKMLGRHRLKGISPFFDVPKTQQCVFDPGYWQVLWSLFFSWQCELWNSEPRRSPPPGPWVSQFLSFFTSALAAGLDEHSRNGLTSFRSGDKNIIFHPCGLGVNTGLSVGWRAGLPLGYSVGRNLPL